MLKLLLAIQLLTVGFVLSIHDGENGGIFREYKEDLNEFLTSEEVDRLVYGNDDSVISEKIRNMPDVNMAPPGSLKHHLPVPTIDPPLDSVPGAPMVKKRPQHNNFMSLMKTAAAKMLGHRQPKRPRHSRPERPVPQYRQRPSSLISSDPDELEIAFKRIEIMASRAGLNMSSIPRRTQMQVVKKLIPKLPPRMAAMMKNTMDQNSVKLYDYLPEPARDPLIEDDPDFIQHFMKDASVTMDAGDFGLMGDHGYEYTESTHEVLPTSHGEVMSHVITDHQPGTDYSVPSYDSGASHSSSSSQSHHGLGLSVPASFDSGSHGYQKHLGGFGGPAPANSFEVVSSKSPIVIETHTVDLKPVAAPLVSESHSTDFQYEASENIPSIISPHSPPQRSPIRPAKAIKSTVKTVSQSAPVFRVSMPTKDEIKIQRPIRVSIITKDNNTNINPFVMSADPIYEADVKEIKKESGEEESKDFSAQESVVVSVSKEVRGTVAPVVSSVRSTASTGTTAPAGILISATSSGNVVTGSAEAGLPAVATTSKSPISKKDNPLLGASSHGHLNSHHQIHPTEEKQEQQEQQQQQNEQPLKFADQLALLDNVKYGPEDDLLFKDTDADYQDLSSSELIAELKKYNQDYGNSLEFDYPLVPHPLEFPDHPDHPDNSDTIVSTASSPTSPRPTMQQVFGDRPRMPHRPGPMRGHMRPRPRPPPHGHPRRPMPHPRRPPPPPRPQHQPLRINDVKVNPIPQTISKECDYFSEDLCLAVQDYPIEAISEAMAQQPETTKMLVKEPLESNWVDGVGKTQEGNYNFKHYYGDKSQENGNQKHRDFAGEGGFLCPSKVAYGKVKKGKSSTTGEWKYIVNYGEVSQTLRLEKCLFPGNACSYVMPYYRTACTQVHNYHRLLAWDSEKGLHMDVFKIPTCCTCHVQGYYVPGQQHGVTPANRRRDGPPKMQFGGRPRPRPSGPHPRGPMMHHQQPPHHPHHMQGGQQERSPLRRESVDQQGQQAQQVSNAKSQQSKFNDELHDLLAQYSSLRERIAKKKTERQNLLSSSGNSTKETSKRESIGRFQRAMVYKMLKRMQQHKNSTSVHKKLMHLLKEVNATAKPYMNLHPNKASHFNGTAHKLRTSRAFSLQKIASVLSDITAGKQAKHGLMAIEKTDGTLKGKARRYRTMLIKELKGNPKAMRRYLRMMKRNRRNGRGMQLRDGAELDEIRMLRRALLKNSRRDEEIMSKDPKQKMMMQKRAGLKVSGKRRLELLKRLQQRRVAERRNEKNGRQRSRFGPNKSSKVNYSYHPIMAYFAGKHS